MEYDVVVVGAGPAGAVAGRYAAQKGAKTLIIDKKRDIGHPVRCAEVVAGSLPDNFGMENSSGWLENETHFFKLISPKGREVRIKTAPFTAYVLNRSAFEKELIRLAVREGAHLILGQAVTGIQGGFLKIGSQTIKSSIVIAADGVDSKIGRLAGIKTRGKTGAIGSCAQHTMVDIDCDPDCLEFYLGGANAPGGYAWVFPKGAHEANAGVGILNPKEMNAVSTLHKFVKTRFPRGQSIRFTSGCVPSTLPPKPCVVKNILIVGDAARQVNPFTGAGIANAFVAGRIAGELSGEIAAKRQPLKRLAQYDTLWRAAFERKLERSLKLRERVLSNDRRIELFIAFLRITPGFVLRRRAGSLHY